jgi:hypothetical protein
MRCHLQAPQAQQSAPCGIWHLASGIRHPASCIPHPASGIRHPASCILHPASRILHPASCILRRFSKYYVGPCAVEALMTFPRIVGLKATFPQFVESPKR